MKYVTDAAKEYAKKHTKKVSDIKPEMLDNPKLAYEKYMNAIDKYNANAKIINEYLQKLYKFDNVKRDVGMMTELDEPTQISISWDIEYNGAIDYLQKFSFERFAKKQRNANIHYYESKHSK